jgi:hypothetical protein
MLFKRFYDDNLAQASYLIACERTREGIVIDPNIDIGQYTRAATSAAVLWMSGKRGTENWRKLVSWMRHR